MLNEEKNNGRCMKCTHRVRYVRFLDGHGAEPPPEEIIVMETRHRGHAPTCWWHQCDRAPHCRGLCRSHYAIFSAGRITVWLNHTGLDEREQLYRTIMRLSEDHQKSVKDAVVFLIDEGAVQYRKRFWKKVG